MDRHLCLHNGSHILQHKPWMRLTHLYIDCKLLGCDGREYYRLREVYRTITPLDRYPSIHLLLHLIQPMLSTIIIQAVPSGSICQPWHSWLDLWWWSARIGHVLHWTFERYKSDDLITALVQYCESKYCDWQDGSTWTKLMRIHCI